MSAFSGLSTFSVFSAFSVRDSILSCWAVNRVRDFEEVENWFKLELESTAWIDDDDDDVNGREALLPLLGSIQKEKNI